MPPTLPPQFVIHIPTRHSAADPFSGYVLLNSVMQPNSSIALTLPSPPPAGPHTIHNTLPDQPLVAATFRLNLQNMSDPAIVLRKAVQLLNRTVHGSDGQVYPIIQIPDHTSILLPRIKRNFTVAMQPQPAAPLVGPIPVPVRRSTPAAPEIPLFVARQLLELAQLKNDMCPIVAEEFSTGNAAVMPCGHLFAQMAIEESFIAAPNVCPACRQPGRPTYV